MKLDTVRVYPYDVGMFRLSLCTALCGLAALVAQAQDESALVSAAYNQLKNGLQEELKILRSITDTATAQAAVSPLNNTLQLLSRREEGISDKMLWNYIDNTLDNKLPLIELIQKLSVEFYRLEQVHFYGCYELRETLLPQLQPNPDKMRD